MLVLASSVALASAPLGHWLALTLPSQLGFTGTGTAPMIAVVTGFFFALAWLGTSLRKAKEQVGLEKCFNQPVSVFKPAPIGAPNHDPDVLSQEKSLGAGK
jgi:hypothetical protein